MNFRRINRLLSEFDSLNKIFDEFYNSTPKQEKGSDEFGDWEKQSYLSDDGLLSYTFFSRKNHKEKIDELSIMKKELDNCVENQDFEKAVELRDKIKVFEKNKDKISKLNQELIDCIKTQNFEKAIEIRDELNKLK